VDKTRLTESGAGVLDTVVNDWLFGRFHSNLRRRVRATPLDLLLNDLETLCLDSVAMDADSNPALAS